MLPLKNADYLGMKSIMLICPLVTASMSANSDQRIERAASAFQQSTAILDLDFALDALAREKPLLAQVIEMQYFAGMTAEEIAEVVDRSVFVVRHEIRLARAWLRRKLSRPDEPR